MTHILYRSLFSLTAAVLMIACSTSISPAVADETHKAHNEPTPYDATRDARADVNGAKATSRMSGKMTLVAMGANWCHDSRALAAHFEKPRFSSLLEDHYNLVYVDVGKKDRNIDLAQDLGVDSIVGTPTVFILSSDGQVLNLETAPTWRNAASRKENDVYTYFESFTKKPSTD